jgi:hypothetical protein
MYGLCMDYGLCIWYCLWMCFVKSILLVNLYMWYCGLCVFCYELKGAEKSVLGGYHEFSSACSEADENTCRPPANQLFSWATGADENSSYFRRPPRPTQIPNQPHIFVGLGEADENRSFSSVPTEIVAYFRRTYFRRLFSSVYAYFRGFLAHENLGVSCSVYNTKLDSKGDVERYKARHVTKGFT